jgi:hypothetical protein
VPCFALDGQYILAALLNVNKKNNHNQFINTTNEAKKPIAYFLIMIFGTLLLFINLLFSMFNLFSSKLNSFFKN